MKRYGYMTCLLVICLLISSTMAEEIGATYSFEFAYGEEAFELHMEDIPNTFEFDGNTYSFSVDGWGDFESEIK